jgi:integrase
VHHSVGREGLHNKHGRTIGGPVEAFATRSLLGTVWRWAKRHKLVPTNVFADLDIEEARKPRRRSRVLSHDEIRRFWAALDDVESLGYTRDCATALRLILVTSARPGMACGMVHDELVDLDAAQPKPVTHGVLRDVTGGNGPLWILPHARMKRDDADDNTEDFIVPLNGMAVDLIKQASGKTGRVFGVYSQTSGQLVSPHKIAMLMRDIVAKLGIPRVTPHDVRRTASMLIRSAVLPDRPKFLDIEVGWLLSHKSPDTNSVTAIYTSSYAKLDEKRSMSTVLGREITRILNAGAVSVRVAA